MTEEKKLTAEMKAKFFALYWGQPVRRTVQWAKPEESTMVDAIISHPIILGFSYLELTPLSQITDEDAKELKNIIRDQTGAVFSQKEIIKDIQVLAYATSGTVDYLRSKGYAVEWLGISVEEQIKLGWIRLKE